MIPVQHVMLHPVSITRFPLSRFSQGAGLLRNPFFTLSTLRFSRGWVRKDGNLVMETGCTCRRARAAQARGARRGLPKCRARSRGLRRPPSLSGVNRGQREHKGSFRGCRSKGVVRCSLDSCLLLSSFFAFQASSSPLKLPSFSTDLY